MASMPRVRARLLELAPRMAFVGAGPNAVAFSENGENTNVAVEVLNVQVSAHSKAAVPVSVAEVAASGTLSGMAAEAVRAYVGPQREPVDLLGVPPTCSAGAEVTTTTTTSTTTPEPAIAASSNNKYLMEMPGVGVDGEPAPALLVLLAAHAPAQAAGLGPGGLGPLHCGELDADALCHLAGAMFAVHRANQNASLLQGQGPKLGLIALDTCGQPGRAYSSLFALLSQPQPTKAAPVAALVLDDAALVTPMVTPLLHMQAIPQLNSTAEREPQRQVVVQARQEALSHALLDVAVALQGHSSPTAEAQTSPENPSATSSSPSSPSSPSLVVLHGSAPRARSLARHLEGASLARCPVHDHDQNSPGPGCLSAVFPMPANTNPAAPGDNGRSGPLYLLSTQAAHSVVILALDSVDEVRSVLLAAQSPLVPRLVFLTALPEQGPEASRSPLRADGHSVLSMVADSSVTTPTATPRDGSLDAAFQQWLGRHHATMEGVGMPVDWANSIRASPCDLDHDQWSRADIMQAVERVARGVRWAAANASRTESDGHLSVRVSRYLEAAADAADAAMEGTTMPPPPQVDTFRIWRGDEPLGSWSPQGGLRLSTDPSLLLDELAVSNRPTLFHNLQYAWAVALLVLALLGILFTLLTAVFFLSAAAVSKTPISGGAGTSVLGYLILLGLLLLHCAVLALVLAPGEVTCGARRMLPALAYALIFAAMFLKVLTTWQVCDRKGGVVRPSLLVLRALGLAAPQLLVTAGWLGLVPPTVHMVGPAHWQCDSAHAPGSGSAQAPHLLLSLAYTCLLMVATAVLALLCSSKEELLEEGTMLRQESRWILVSAVAVAVQLGCWGLAVVAGSTSSPLAGPGRADLLAASVHALAAATLLLCLFLPKLRLYLRLRRDARNTAAIAASAAARSAASRSQPIYGISHFQPFGGKLNPAFDAPSTDMSLGESASQSASDQGSHSGSEAEGDYNDPLDPTQVVPSSLYSIDMFSSQDSSSQGITDLPVVAIATGDGRGTVRGTICGVRPHPHSHLHPYARAHPHASLFGTVRGDRCVGGTLRSAHGGTLRSVQALVQGGTVRGPPGVGGTPRGALTTLHGTVRGSPLGPPRVSHFLPGSNEFTAPHRSSSMLLLPGQESISYM